MSQIIFNVQIRPIIDGNSLIKESENKEWDNIIPTTFSTFERKTAIEIAKAIATSTHSQVRLTFGEIGEGGVGNLNGSYFYSEKEKIQAWNFTKSEK